MNAARDRMHDDDHRYLTGTEIDSLLDVPDEAPDPPALPRAAPNCGNWRAYCRSCQSAAAKFCSRHGSTSFPGRKLRVVSVSLNGSSRRSCNWPRNIAWLAAARAQENDAGWAVEIESYRQGMLLRMVQQPSAFPVCAT